MSKRVQARILKTFCIRWQRGRVPPERAGESTKKTRKNTKGLTCHLREDSIKQLSWQLCQVTSDKNFKELTCQTKVKLGQATDLAEMPSEFKVFTCEDENPKGRVWELTAWCENYNRDKIRIIPTCFKLLDKNLKNFARVLSTQVVTVLRLSGL